MPILIALYNSYKIRKDTEIIDSLQINYSYSNTFETRESLKRNSH